MSRRIAVGFALALVTALAGTAVLIGWPFNNDLGACRAWGVEAFTECGVAKIGPSEDSFCRIRRLIERPGVLGVARAIRNGPVVRRCCAGACTALCAATGRPKLICVKSDGTVRRAGRHNRDDDSVDPPAVPAFDPPCHQRDRDCGQQQQHQRIAKLRQRAPPGRRFCSRAKCVGAVFQQPPCRLCARQRLPSRPLKSLRKNESSS